MFAKYALLCYTISTEAADRITSGSRQNMDKEYPAIDMLKTGQNIKKIMKLKGLTVKDIQNFLNLSAPQGIYHWFIGKSMPSLDNLYALSELFGLPMDIMIIGDRKFVFASPGRTWHQGLYIYYIKLILAYS